MVKLQEAGRVVVARAELDHPRVVDEHQDRSQLRRHVTHHPSSRGVVGQVGHEPRGLVTHRTELLGPLVYPLGG